MKTKICTKCKKEFPATTEFFYSDRSKKLGLCSSCKECHRKSYKRQRKNILLYKKHQRNDNPDYMRQWRKDNPGYNEKYYQKNRSKILENQKDYRKTPRCKELNRRKSKRYYKKNKLSACMSSMIHQSIKSSKSGRHWETLVPYTLEELKQYLESLFQPGMSWKNHSRYGWHIDHKIPISSFNITSYDCEDFKKCWALENLQPLWAEENLRKHDKLDWEKRS